MIENTLNISDTTFEIGEATCSKNAETYNLTLPVSNTGRRDGTEVVQVYIRNTADKEGPLKTLRAFQRVDVKAGQTVNAMLQLTRKSFEGWDAETNTIRVVPGTYELFYGNSSQNLKSMIIQIQ